MAKRKQKQLRDSNGRFTANLPDVSSVLQVQAIDLNQMLGGGTTSGIKTLDGDAIWKFFKRWAYAAADATAKGIMMADLAAQTLQADEDDEEEQWKFDYEHPLSNLIKFINPYMTSAEFKYWVVADLEMCGESFWKIIENGMGEPGQLWPIVGDMKPKIAKGDETELLGWDHSLGAGKTELLEPHEVMFLRYPKPGHFWKGYGPAQAAAAELQLDDELVKSMWSKFKQGAFPSALLFMETKDEELRDKYVNKLSAKISGSGNAGKVVGLASTMKVEWPKLIPVLGDIKGADSVRDTILGVMRVPKEILGLGVDANRASIWGMKQIFADFKLKPTAKMIEERLDQDLVPMFEGGDDVNASTRMKFTALDPVDPELIMKQEEQDLKLYVRSIDEIRAARGMKAAPWGALPIAPISVGPLNDEEVPPEGDAE